MRQVTLGRTGISVSELCLGALPMGPGQKNLPVEEGGRIIAACFKGGCNFIDTAQMYRTYPHIRCAMDNTGITPVISTKSAASTYEDMDLAVQEALTALGLDTIDIFLLHAARASEGIFEQRAGALQCLLDYKAKGIIKATGISTHAVNAVEAAAEHDDIDVIFPVINNLGLGILNGNTQTMEAAIRKAFAADKGVFFMKALAGGRLVRDYDNAMSYARKLSDGRAAIAVGMVSEWEAEMNTRFFNGEDISAYITDLPQKEKRFTVLKFLCVACGNCENVCHSDAITQGEDGKYDINHEKCLLCGYCVDGCPSFCIRLI